MGVTGLWRLVEPAGRPVPVETLENKVLAVDISIWLHQMVKGYQDAKGAPLPSAHLMGLFQRLCKLLYFRIKPVFVFDGGFPELKRETIAKRQDSKAKYHSESERLKRDLALLLSKKTAVSSLLGKQISPKKGTTPNTDDDLFKLPALPQQEQDESESDEEDSSGSIIDLHSIDMESESFKSLPVKEKYDLLVELKETRKMNSWGKIHELPKKSDNFSDFQLQRLLKRRKVQECLEETEKEIGDTGMSLLELESLLNEEGIETKIESLPTRRIASSNNTRILMINNVKQALAEAKQRQEAAEKLELQKRNGDKTIEPTKSGKKDEMEEDIEKAIKLSLECANEADTSACTSKTDDSWTSVLSDTDYSDSEDGDGYEQPDMSSAKAYIMQYSDFTNKAINDLVAPKHNNKPTSKISKVDKIIEELKGEKSVILDKVDLSSSDEDTEIIDQIRKDDEVTSTINLDITNIESDSEVSNVTQSSVVFVEKPTPVVISLDTSTESVKDSPKENIKTNQIITVKQEVKESDTSDDEFEEVPDVDDKPHKPAVQITLKVDAAPEPDDIFSDVFTKPNPKDICLEVTPNKTSITTEMFRNAIEDLDFKNTAMSVKEDMHKPSTSGVIFKPPLTDKSSKTMCDEFSDDLEKAIKLSLECANEDANASKTNKVKQVELANELNNAVKYANKLDSSEGITSKDEPVEIIDDFEKAIKMSLECVKETIASGTPKEDESTVAKFSKEKSDVFDDDIEKAIKMSLECENELDNEAAHAPKAASEVRVEENTSSEANVAPSKENELAAQEIRIPPREPLSTEQLNTMAEELQNEEQELIQEKGRLDRIGRNITEQMTKEAQELLQIFGIPYIVAPMEAEAQCAFLESVNLTDGTITDDSDIWLFGGRTVYKNFFNQKKHVMQFVAERIERSFNLSREQLVLLALLVGSDYTTGVAGVGPVTAMEILASFPYNKKQFVNDSSKQARYAQIVTGLQEFKKWVKAGKRTDNVTLKKKLKNIDLTEDFPSVRVVQAYLEPNVEKSDEKFTWGEIDITILRDYAKKKFGWSQNKLDEIVKPVLKRILDRKTQRSVQDYFKKKVEYQSLEEHMSKRVKAAVQRMGPESSITTGESLEEPAKPARKRKVNKAKEVGNDAEVTKPGPSKAKQKKTNELDVLKKHGVTVVSQIQDGKSSIEINIPKSDRFQEIIPQREKDKQSLLQNKMKAIEIFRKTKIDKKKKLTKRRVNIPKEKAELSESSDSN